MGSRCAFSCDFLEQYFDSDALERLMWNGLGREDEDCVR